VNIPTRAFDRGRIADEPAAQQRAGEARSALTPLRDHNLQLFSIVEWVLLAFLLALFVGRDFIPGWRTLNSDFPNHYLAAVLHHEGTPLDRIYEWTWFQRQNDHLGVHDGLVSFAPNPPASVLPFLPLAWFSPLTAKRVWLVVLLVFLALSLVMLERVTSLGWRRLALITLLCIAPLHINFIFGRYYPLILLLICGSYYAFRTGHPMRSGTAFGIAAALKLFPALSILLFARKRNARAMIGLISAAMIIVAASLLVFGVEVHRVFLYEILPQISRGDWLGPYALSQNSFITLWSHLFLIEPELNPSPFINSPVLYALAQALSVMGLLLVFVLFVERKSKPPSEALHWAALVPLMLLLSSTTGSDHACLLIFTAIVGVDALLAADRKGHALVVLLLYVFACSPLPGKLSGFFPLIPLIAKTALYVVLLQAGANRTAPRKNGKWIAASVIGFAVLAAYNLHTVRDRAEDFRRRVPGLESGYSASDPVLVSGRIAFTSMRKNGYAGVVFHDGAEKAVFRDTDKDALSIAGADGSPFFYGELAGRRSLIERVPIDLGSSLLPLVEGQNPALSADGKWLAFIREDRGVGTAWMIATDSTNPPKMILDSSYHPLDLGLTPAADVIAAAGDVSHPHLILARAATGTVEDLAGISGPARYPSISPDGKRLAYSRRDRGFWHLVVRDLADGREQQLTHGSCNATSASWGGRQTLLYATDCGRGIGLSSIAQVAVPD
jgi:hypothetical protein